MKTKWQVWVFTGKGFVRINDDNGKTSWTKQGAAIVANSLKSDFRFSPSEKFLIAPEDVDLSKAKII